MPTQNEYKLSCFSSTDELAAEAAERVADVIGSAIELRGKCALALSGGSTPRILFRRLCREEFRKRVDWTRVDFFWGDERCVPPNDEHSNYRMATECLLEPLDVDAARVYRMQGERDDTRLAAEDYQQQIADYFSVSTAGPPPSFDLILLGMGDDGHTASLFPRTAALRDSAQWVAANEVPQLAATRITLTARLINHAQAIVFLIAGQSKAPALAAVLEGARRPERYPCQLIRPVQGSLEFFVDFQAAQMLQSTRQS